MLEVNLNTIEGTTRVTGRAPSWKKLPEWPHMDEKKQNRTRLSLTVLVFVTLTFTTVVTTIQAVCSFCFIIK